MTAQQLATRTGADPGPCSRRPRSRTLLALAPILFVLLSGTLVLGWAATDSYSTVGDEPHYLTISRGLFTEGALEQTGVYTDEYSARRFWDGWPAAGNTLTDNTGHTVVGPNGRFSVHNLGLPTVIGAPATALGTVGARLLLVVLAAALALLASLVAARDLPGRWQPVLVGVTLACALPFLTAATRIYPDVLSGVCFLAGCVALLVARDRGPRLLWVPFAAAAALPWLQIKLGVLAVLLIAAALRRARTLGGARRIDRRVLLPVGSVVALLAYNAYAFGSPTGPYGEGALEPGARALQTFLGLLVDQNHGLLFQHPVLLLAGVVGLAPLFARDRLVAVTVGVGAATILALNALHVNWYGGFGFAGRFMVTAAALLVLPAAVLLAQLLRRAPRATTTMLLGSALGQAALYVRYAEYRSPGLLYGRNEDTWLLEYGGLLATAQRWLPALHDPDWAWRYAPNYLWLAAFLLVSSAGVLAWRRLLPRWTPVAVTLLAGTLVLAGPLVVPAPREALTVAFPADVLPATTGTLVAGQRTGVPPGDDAGYLVFGPGRVLPEGSYMASFTLTSPASPSTEVGLIDVLVGAEPAPVAERSLAGSEGRTTTVRVPFSVRSAGPFQARVLWYGNHELAVAAVAVTAS